MSSFTTHNRPLQISNGLPMVDPAKSKRLRAMRDVNNQEGVDRQPSVNEALSGSGSALPAEVRRELLRAKALIDETVARVTACLPEGKKARLFAVRFGPLEALYALEIQEIFKRLHIDGKRVDLNRLRKINYHGDKIT